ncbi:MULTISPECIES: hypothetical protein [unclassified Pseudomonas]|uniref:DUF6962 family protein n=1 Tax=unclassified Pseudomonas TaxID=196821 RepID=UPI00244AEF46|nr:MULTISPECIES: hypothetical protein [unclassified Pseudomonas]MDG9923864.1 hypothetical protein [Pseudomonas sp. GD04045]MDH0035861.1 hypothetical protein [Pseudomonas sp. GD04019]
MQYSTAFSDGALALACLASLLWLRPAFSGQPVLRALLLGFGLTATAALCGAVRYGLDPSWIDKHRSFTQLSAALGLPLLGLATFALARGLAWARPIWTVWLLALVGLFIGARVFGVDQSYRLALNLVTLLLILYAGLSRWPQLRPGLQAIGVVGLFLIAGVAVGTEGFIGPIRRVDLFHALLTPAYPLLAWLLLTLRMPAREEIPVKTL